MIPYEFGEEDGVDIGRRQIWTTNVQCVPLVKHQYRTPLCDLYWYIIVKVRASRVDGGGKQCKSFYATTETCNTPYYHVPPSPGNDRGVELRCRSPRKPYRQELTVTRSTREDSVKRTSLRQHHSESVMFTDTNRVQ
jgi:hypothetical protein